MISEVQNRIQRVNCRVKSEIGICLLLMAILMLPGVSVEAGHTGQSAAQRVSAPVEERVENLLRSMTLEEKIGQMLMIGIQGTDVDEESLFMLHQYHIGGIILFDRNMKTQEQVKQLNAHLQEQAGEKCSCQHLQGCPDRFPAGETGVPGGYHHR